MVEKIKPDAEIRFSYGNDGRDAYYYVGYSCPKCHKKINLGDMACDECGSFFDWNKKAEIVIRREIIWK